MRGFRIRMGDLTAGATLVLGVVILVFVVYLFFQYEGFQGAEATTRQEKKEDQEPRPSKELEAVVTAPGVLRPANGSSERATFPTAVNLAEDRPFETYVQMLVRSEMAAQGVPTNEPFQLQEVIENAGRLAAGKATVF